MLSKLIFVSFWNTMFQIGTTVPSPIAHYYYKYLYIRIHHQFPPNIIILTTLHFSPLKSITYKPLYKTMILNNLQSCQRTIYFKRAAITDWYIQTYKKKWFCQRSKYIYIYTYIFLYTNINLLIYNFIYTLSRICIYIYIFLLTYIYIYINHALICLF